MGGILLITRREGGDTSVSIDVLINLIHRIFLTLILNTIHVDSTSEQSTLILVFYLS